MYKVKLCLGTSDQYGIGIKEQITIFKNTGFDAYFLVWNKDIDMIDIKKHGDSLGMIFQSVHAPFYNVDKMWEKEETAKDAIDVLLKCLEDCAKAEVPIMVCHSFIGFDKHTPTYEGISHFKIIVDRAKELGIKIAFENIEGEEYLESVMTAFSDYDNVGFCWDTDHEMCYNHNKDMMALYGDKILCTHLNDNLGISDYNGKIFWTDDLHLLPFDGVADWKSIVHRLNRHNYNDILTFELKIKSKPERHENDVYEKMPVEEYICEAYKRACKVAMMKLRDNNSI